MQLGWPRSKTDDGMDRLRRLLAHGFFPREVPQCFVSESYGEAVTDDAANIPTDMTGSKKRKPRPLARTTSRESVNCVVRYPSRIRLAISH